MTTFDSTEAPVTTTVDTRDEGYTGRHDERPIKMAVDLEDDDVEVARSDLSFKEAQVGMGPGEAYHLADDLQDAADDCWGVVERVVTAVRHDGDEEVYLATVKAPSPDVAVEKAIDLLEAMAEADDHPDAQLSKNKLVVVETTGRFRTYRADSMDVVTRETDE